MGSKEARTQVLEELPLKYHPYYFRVLINILNQGVRQCLVGSLTGAVASQRVTEACEGSLRLIGNQPRSIKAKGSLTARKTFRAGRKLGLSDPAVLNGRAVAQRIKGTPGITG